MQVALQRQRGARAIEHLERAPLVGEFLVDLALLRPIPHDLHEADVHAGLVADGREFADRPEATAILAHPPPLLATASAGGQGVRYLGGQDAGDAIRFDEDQVDGPASNLGFGPTEDVASPLAPACDAPGQVRADDRRFDGAVDDLAPGGRRDGGSVVVVVVGSHDDAALGRS